ncbi:hypothetical protein [Bordetella trematum]|uniref:hypothetical protein n=1 Tax=Bordetella trematum TaxID=123899 RepID=UPI0012E747EC|nr:hypothetical protein [Bordetella trematum]
MTNSDLHDDSRRRSDRGLLDVINSSVEDEEVQRNDASWPRRHGKLAHSYAIDRALVVLEFLMQKNPTNDELLKVYKELCVEDAKLEQQEATLRSEQAHANATERLELAKLQVSVHATQTKSLIETNKLYHPVDGDRRLEAFVHMPEALLIEADRGDRSRRDRDNRSRSRYYR